MSFLGSFLGGGGGGGISTDPGVANVVDGVTYTINGVPLVGTFGAIIQTGNPFLDMIAADMQAINLNTSEGAVICTYIPREQGEDGAGFSVTLSIGHDPVQIAVIETGAETSDRRAEAICQTGTLLAGILSATGTERLPGRGDRLLVPSTARAYAGLWSITEADPDTWGACTLHLRQESTLALAAASVRGT